MKKLVVLAILSFLWGIGCATSSLRAYTLDPAVPEIDLGGMPGQNRRPAQDSSLALAIAISGGGHRSANFAVGVLTGLERIDVLKEVDYLSTVSGGGFAAGAYIGTLVDHLGKGGTHADYSLNKYLNQPEEPRDDTLKRHLERGYETSLFWGFANPKTWFSNIDRGDFLEKKIDSRILGFNRRQRSLLLEDIFRDEEAAGCNEDACFQMVPYWVANATVYENGAIFPFTPDILSKAKYNIVQYSHRASLSQLGDDKGKLPLAVGVKASASFPVAFPATTLKSMSPNGTEAFIHLLDGGLADNLGVLTAIKMLKKDTSERKVLFIIDAYKDNPQPFSKREGAPTAGEVALRIMGIGLDANHSRIEIQVRNLCEPNNIKPIFLDFKSLKGEEDEIVKQVSRALFEGKSLEADREILYRNVRDVETSFNISREEQELLLEAGRRVVKSKENDIRKAIERR